MVKLILQHLTDVSTQNFKDIKEEEYTMASRNSKVVPEAKAALNQMKLETANELGLSNYEGMDKGNLTARQNGYVGGYMTKKLVEMAENQIAGKK